jgi:hypothetical protein
MKGWAAAVGAPQNQLLGLMIDSGSSLKRWD